MPVRDSGPAGDVRLGPPAIGPVAVRTTPPEPIREVAEQPLAFPTEPPVPPQAAAPVQPLAAIEEPSAPRHDLAPVRAGTNPPAPSVRSMGMPAVPALPEPSLDIAAPEAPQAPSAPALRAASEIRFEPARATANPEALSPSLPAIPAPSVVAPPSSPLPPQAASAPDIEFTPELVRANYLRNPKPVYPSLSRHLGEQGTVLLRVLVTARGEPVQVQLKSSSGYSRLDRAALDAVRRWLFVPAKRGDDIVDAWVIVPIEFSIKN
ncbi:MAG TPA: TonB family protein [Burkholderiales bacterium]|nr:TonB family protein [Burkholderiales bacterium]